MVTFLPVELVHALYLFVTAGNTGIAIKFVPFGNLCHEQFG
jgi:hypothetical protein